MCYLHSQLPRTHPRWCPHCICLYPNCSICHQHQSWSRHAPIRPIAIIIIIAIATAIIAIFIEVASMIFLYKFLCIESISLLICFVLVPNRPISTPPQRVYQARYI